MAGNGSQQPLVIRLFGPFDVQIQGQSLPRTRTRKEQWLLALLALRHDRALDRNWLAGLFWSDSTEKQALINLRRSLSNLRSVLGREATRLTSPTPRTLRLEIADADIDVLSFDKAISRGGVASLQTAVALYQGYLLEGCDEAWVLPERAAREQDYLQALETLAQHSTPTEAIDYLRRVTAIDPTRESALRALMEALAACGDHAAVLQTYRDFRIHLYHELHASPDSTTAALYQRLKAQTPASQPPSSRLPSALTTLPRLPIPRTPLVGREEAMESVLDCLHSAPLVTLVGAGGVGKTRLAIAAADRVAEDYTDGVCFVDLASVADPAYVPRSVATALGLQEQKAFPLLQTLQNALESRSLLMLLDNCEHVIEACAQLADSLLGNCPGLRILATSRQPLRIPGERVWRVPSLTLPPDRCVMEDEGLTSDAPLTMRPSLLTYAAVHLFVERVSWADSSFRLTPHNTRAVAEICCRLDGIPLALELAAAQTPGLSVEQIAANLDDRFQLLTRGSRTALPRQQTLRATLDWSYELLTESERRLLRRLWVFTGDWTLEAAEVVCADLKEWEVVDLLTSLVDKSMIHVVHEDEIPQGQRVSHTTRYRLLETVRQYCGERLFEVGEVESIQAYHADYYFDLVERLSTQDREPGWYPGLDKEYHNVRVALEGSLNRPDALWKAIHVACLLEGFWFSRGSLQEAWTWWSKALANREALPMRLRARALRSAGEFASVQVNQKIAQTLLEEGLEAAQQTKDKSLLALAWLSLGRVSRRHDNLSEAEAYYQQALLTARDAGEETIAAWCLEELGINSAYQGDVDRARRFTEESLRFFRSRDKQGTARALLQLGNLLKDRMDDRIGARRCLEESLTLHREIGDRIGIAWTLADLGDLAWMEGDLASARDLVETSLATRREIGDHIGVAHALRILAMMSEEEGDLNTAQRLLEESLAIRLQVDERVGIARVLLSLGQIHHRQGDIAAAYAAYARSLEIGRELEDYAILSRVLLQLAMTLADPHTIAWLYGAAEALQKAVDVRFTETEHADFALHLDSARSALSQAAFSAAWAEGSAMPLDLALAFALDVMRTLQ